MFCDCDCDCVQYLYACFKSTTPVKACLPLFLRIYKANYNNTNNHTIIKENITDLFFPVKMSENVPRVVLSDLKMLSLHYNCIQYTV